MTDEPADKFQQDLRTLAAAALMSEYRDGLKATLIAYQNEVDDGEPSGWILLVKDPVWADKLTAFCKQLEAEER